MVCPPTIKARCASPANAVAIANVATLLVNTKEVHAVVYDYGWYTRDNARVSLTAKWENVGYQTLIDNLK